MEQKSSDKDSRPVSIALFDRAACSLKSALLQMIALAKQSGFHPTGDIKISFANLTI
jgi:hypothetical protein